MTSIQKACMLNQLYHYQCPCVKQQSNTLGLLRIECPSIARNEDTDWDEDECAYADEDGMVFSGRDELVERL